MTPIQLYESVNSDFDLAYNKLLRKFPELTFTPFDPTPLEERDEGRYYTGHNFTVPCIHDPVSGKKLKLKLKGHYHYYGQNRVAQFERSLINERRREGMAIAKAQGKHIGRPRTITDEAIKEMVAMVKSGEPKARVAQKYGISRIEPRF